MQKLCDSLDFGCSMNGQLVVELEQEEEVAKTYHIFLSNNTNILLIFLKKNLDIMEFNNLNHTNSQIKPNFKIIYSSSLSKFSKFKFKD
jgi:hypothetical protein